MGSILTTIAGLVFTSLLTLAIYRLYFHPLSRYPGPFWAKLSSFPSFWHTIKGDRHVWQWRLQQKYGSTFRYRPDAVLINTPTGFRTIFGPNGNVKKCDDYYRVWPRTADVTSTWNCTDVKAHARKKRVLSQAFSEKALRNAEEFVATNLDRWLELLREKSAGGKVIDMARQVEYLVFDILGDLCFGKSFGMIEEGSQMRHIPGVLATFLKIMHPICFSPWSAWWVWAKPRGLDTLLDWTSPPAVTDWFNFVAKCLVERTVLEDENRAAGIEGRKDFFHFLFNARDPETGEGYSLPELYGECELLIVAGSDTTSTVLAAATFYLARNPQIQEKLAEELRSTFTSLFEIHSGPQLQSCKYLKAFIQETCRMAPPTAAELAREVLHGGTTVDGHYFPSGTKLSTSTYCLSYNAEIYPSPFTFSPERWLPMTPEQEAGFCAFSTGPRGCVGKNLAWLEMMLVLAKLVWKFEIVQEGNVGGGERCGEEGRREEGQYQLYDAFVALREGPMVKLKGRGE